MDLVSFVVLEARSAEFGRLCAPSRSPEERVLVWSGLPPPAAVEETNLARVVLQGDCDGRRVYVETVPRGVRLSVHDSALPDTLRNYVVGSVLKALASLHRGQQVHGHVRSDHVWLGVDGTVCLAGRGRRGAVPQHDLLAAAGLTGREQTVPGRDCEEAAVELLARAGAGAQEQLAAFVAERADEEDVAGEEWLIINLDDSTVDGSVDEVSPYLGPDEEQRGIMDRWSVNPDHDFEVTTTGCGIDSGTSEQTDFGRSNTLSLELWSRLAAPPQPASPSRFSGVNGQSSRGIRGLLAEEVPDVLPSPVEARLGSIIVQNPDTSVTNTRTAPYATQLAEPEYIRDPRSAAAFRERVALPPGRSVALWQLGIAMLIGGLAMFTVMRLLG